MNIFAQFNNPYNLSKFRISYQFRTPNPNTSTTEPIKEQVGGSNTMAISDFSNDQMIHPSDEYKKDAYINTLEEYRRLYKMSIEDPSKFWLKMSKNYYWKKPPTLDSFIDYNFDITKGPVYTRWMEGAKTNMCYNALDRHVENGLGNRIAFYW